MYNGEVPWQKKVCIETVLRGSSNNYGVQRYKSSSRGGLVEEYASEVGAILAISSWRSKPPRSVPPTLSRTPLKFPNSISVKWWIQKRDDPQENFKGTETNTQTTHTLYGGGNQVCLQPEEEEIIVTADLRGLKHLQFVGIYTCRAYQPYALKFCY